MVMIESMKMEIAVTANYSGKVSQVLCSAGGAVAAGQALIVLEELA
jgi:urea carboxylase